MLLTDTIANKTTNASVLNNITRVNSVTEIVLSIQNKKRQIENAYLSGQWKDVDEYEFSKFSQIIYNRIFKYVKFIKGEDVKVILNVGKRNSSKALAYGKYHETANLTKRTGYEYALVNFVSLTEENSKLVKHFYGGRYIIVMCMYQ